MSNRNYDMSHFIKRRSDKTTAQSFLTRIQPPNNSGLPCQVASAPYLGISSYSIMNAVRSGSMTEYSRCDYGNGELISVGCPCPRPDPNLFIPGIITNLQISYGSIILSWEPYTGMNGPYYYEITPYLNGVALQTVVTGDTTYKFTDLEEFKPYTFTVRVFNQYGRGASVSNGSAVIMPPNNLGSIMKGVEQVTQDGMPGCIKYIIGNAIGAMLEYIASINLGPTRSSRLMYLWSASVAQAWNWVSLSSAVSGSKDGWDWTNNKCSLLGTVTDTQRLQWMCLVIDEITTQLSGKTYSSKFECPDSVVSNVKSVCDWNGLFSTWTTWLNGRKADGSVAAGTTMPTESSNWGKTIVVDGVTINDITGFPAPSEWTRLTVQGKKQGYLTYNWGSVNSTCLTSDDETTIINSVEPKTGSDRDAEVDITIQLAEEMGTPGSVSDLRKMMAEFWAGGPGTVSPPCMFIWMWREYTRSLQGLSCDKLIYSLLDLSIHLFEGGRLTWSLKKKFMEARPIQEIRRRYIGVNLNTWDGSIVKGDQWTPYQEANFVTPPFADFPSGHSHFSKAFALSMQTWFTDLNSNLPVNYCNPKLISPLFKDASISSNFGTFSFNKGVSDIQPGIVPSEVSQLSFENWDDMATSAGMSRLYGGIHCISAHTSSQQVAIQVDNLIKTNWNITLPN